MAMSGTILKAAIIASIESELGFTVPEEGQKVYGVIADEIVKHISTLAVVTTAVSVTSVTAVTPGPGVSGPGVGVGAGTIS